MDEPKEGRFDGENSNFGLVDEKDELYKVLTDSLKKINKKIEGEILCLKK
jgi:agarase